MLKLNLRLNAANNFPSNLGEAGGNLTMGNVETRRIPAFACIQAIPSGIKRPLLAEKPLQKTLYY